MLLFLAYVLIGILFWRLRALTVAVEETATGLRKEADRREILADQLLTLKRRTAPPVPVAPEAQAPPRSAPVVRPVIPDQPAPRIIVPEVAPEPAPVQAPEAPPPLPKEYSFRPTPTQHTPSVTLGEMAEATGGWEQLIGGNLLNKLGALVLVIGIALFLSYSFANMGPAGRAFTSLALSGTLLAAGVALERSERYRLFSRGILASGWAALYFTSYAMHALPAARIIESSILGTSLMLGVAAGMVLHSLRYRVQSLTALSYGCIFAALALSNLNTFVAISLVPLAVSMLYLARRFDWHAMALFAAAATYGVFVTRPDSGASLASIESMLVLFWVLFESFDLLRIRTKAEATPFHHALFAINAFAGLGASAALWYRMAPDSMWMFSAGAAVLYLASTWVRFVLEGETHYEYTLSISAVMTGLAIVARVPGLWSSLGIMIEAEVLFLVALRLRIPVAKVLSWVGFLAAAKQILDFWAPETTLIGGLTVQNMTPPMVIMAGLFLLNRYLAKQEQYWSYLASLLLVISILVESSVPLLGTVWLVYAAILFEFGLRKALSEYRYQAYGIAALGSVATVLTTLDQPQGPAWVLAVGGAYFLGQALRATKWLPSLDEVEQHAIRFGAATGTSLMLGLLIHRVISEQYEALALLAASMLMLEVALRRSPAEFLRPALTMNAIALLRLMGTHADGIGKSPEPAVWISFGGTALAYAFVMVRFLRGTSRSDELARSAGSVLASILSLLTLWMVLPDVWVPVAFAALAALFVELGLFAKAEDLTALGRGLSGISIATLIALAPPDLWSRVAVNFAVAGFQYWTHFRLRRLESQFIHGCAAAAIMTATLFNEVSGGMLTLSWSIEGIALLSFGFMTRDRWLRLPGLGLLFLCIGKLFFYDLRNLETVYRILSFIGLGLILLGVSWIYTRFKEQLQKLL